VGFKKRRKPQKLKEEGTPEWGIAKTFCLHGARRKQQRVGRKGGGGGGNWSKEKEIYPKGVKKRGNSSKFEQRGQGRGALETKRQEWNT